LDSDAEWFPLFLDRGELTFKDGRLLFPADGVKYETFEIDASTRPLNINIDFSRARQSTSPFNVFSQIQDGRSEGELLGIDVENDGTVMASYSNAEQVRLGKVVIVRFPTPTGLRQMGDSTFVATKSSGDPDLGEPGTSGFGSIRSGSIERSNVDLTQELVDLITAQRNFQANAKAIETNSTMTQSIINIRS